MEGISFIAEHKHFFVIAHVLCVVLGMGSALVTDILALRFGFDKRLSKFEVHTVRFLSQVVTIALVGIVTTGATIFLSNPEQYGQSVKFLTKMTIVGVLILNGYLLHKFIFSRIADPRVLTSPKARSLRRLGFALGAVSIVSWISALSLGVLLHIPVSYDMAIALYSVGLIVAVVVSQVVESILLERKRS